MKNVDFLIIGQGLAGSLLADALLTRGATVAIIDDDKMITASKVAAGVIHPITGRRMVKSWLIDDLLPFAEKTYTALEQRFGISIFRHINVVRLLHTIEEENEWTLRSSWADYAPYVIASPSPSPSMIALPSPPERGEFKVEGLASPPRGGMERAITHNETRAAQVQIAPLLQQFRRYFLEKNVLQFDVFDHDKLTIFEQSVIYNGKITAKKIIFCEGAGVANNPFFNFLPITPDKGELQMIRLREKMMIDKVWKLSQLAVVPQPQTDLLWVGATHERDPKHIYPTQAAQAEITNTLNTHLTLPYDLVRSDAAIRATTRDRRPILGFHPIFPSLAIVNGMGAKGASLTPFWTAHFADVLSQTAILDKVVDLKRFL